MARFVLSAFADEAGAPLKAQIEALIENDIHFIEPRNIDGKSIIDFTDEEAMALYLQLEKNGIKGGSQVSPNGKQPISGHF